MALALYLASGCYTVSTDQQAVVLRFGRVVASHVPAGMHWTWPAPIGGVDKLRVRETRRLTVGLEPNNPYGVNAQFLTGDSNILNVRLVVQFAVNDPVAYLFGAQDVDAAIAAVAQGALVQAVAERGVDDLLTTQKIAVQLRVQALAEATLANYDCGVSVLGVVLDDVEPPPDVVDAFRLVSSAREDSDRIVHEAETYANGLLPVARGDADQMGSQAEAYRTTRTDDAVGEAARFSALAAEAAKAPTETAARLYLETMEAVLPKMDLLVLGADGKTVDLQFFRIKGGS